MKFTIIIICSVAIKISGQTIHLWKEVQYFRDSTRGLGVSTFPDAMVIPLVNKNINFLLNDWSKTEPYSFPEIQDITRNKCAK